MQSYTHEIHLRSLGSVNLIDVWLVHRFDEFFRQTSPVNRNLCTQIYTVSYMGIDVFNHVNAWFDAKDFLP